MFWLRCSSYALRPADAASGAVVDMSGGLQRPPSPLPQTGNFAPSSPPLLLSCVLRGNMGAILEVGRSVL